MTAELNRILTWKDLEERGAALVASGDTGLLYEFPDKASGDWRSLYLRLKQEPASGRTKRVWWLGWNGHRLSRNRDVVHLMAQHPGMHRWVIEVLSQ